MGCDEGTCQSPPHHECGTESASTSSKMRHARMMAVTAKTAAQMSAGSIHPSVKNAGARRNDMMAMHFMGNRSNMYVPQSYGNKAKETKEKQEILWRRA